MKSRKQKIIAGIIVLVIVGLVISGYCLKKKSDKEKVVIGSHCPFRSMSCVVEEVIDKEHVLVKVIDCESGDGDIPPGEKRIYGSGEKVILNYKYLCASCNEVKKNYIQAGGQPEKGDIIKTQYAKEGTKKGETYDILLCEKIELWDIEKERFDKMEGEIRDNEIK